MLWAFVYCAYPLSASGRTFGMAALGVRAVRADGRDLNTRQAIVRVLAFPLSFLLFGLGFILILLRRDRRALHDLIAVDRGRVCVGRPSRPPAVPAQALTYRHWSLTRPLRRLRRPWAMRCSFSMRAKRTKPSPPGPKPAPGDRATSQSRTTMEQNSTESSSR